MMSLLKNRLSKFKIMLSNNHTSIHLNLEIFSRMGQEKGKAIPTK